MATALDLGVIAASVQLDLSQLAPQADDAMALFGGVEERVTALEGVMTSVIEPVGAFGDALSALSGVVTESAGALSALAEAADAVGGALANAGAGLDAMQASVEAQRAQIDELTYAYDRLTGAAEAAAAGTTRVNPTSYASMGGGASAAEGALSGASSEIGGIASAEEAATAAEGAASAAVGSMAEATAGIEANAGALSAALDEAFATLRESFAAAFGDLPEMAQEAMAGVAEAVTTGVAQAADAARALEPELAAPLEALPERIAPVSEGFAGLFDTLGEGVKRATEFGGMLLEFEAFQGASDAVGSFVGNLIGMNSEMEALHQQLTSITGSGAEADKITAWIKQFGQQVPFTTESLARATVTIQALGLNAEQLMPSLASVAAAMGADLPTAAQAFMDAYEGRFQMLQRDLHVSKEELVGFGLEIGKNGKVVQSTLAPAFERLAQAKFGDALKNQMTTLSGQLSNLTDRVQFFAMNLGRPLFDTAKQGLGALFGFLDEHKAQVDGFADVVGHGLADGVHALGEAVQAVASPVAGLVGALGEHAAEAVTTLKAGVTGLGAGLLAFGASFLPAAITGLGGLTGALLTATAAALANPFVQVGLAVAALALAAQVAYTHFQPFHQAVDAIGATLAAFWGAVVRAGQALATFLTPFAREAGGALATFGEQIGARVGPALLTLATLIQAALGGIQTVWNAVWPTLGQTLRAAWDTMTGVVRAAWAVISGLVLAGLDLLGGNLRQAGADLQGIWGGVWTNIRGAAASALGGLGTLAEDAGKGLLDALGHLPGPVGDWSRSVRAHFDTLTQGALDALGRVVTGARDWVGNLASAVGPHLADFGALVRDNATRAWGWLLDRWNAVAPQIVPAVQGFAGQVGQRLADLGGVIRERAGQAWGWISDRWNALSPQVLPAIQGFAGQVGSRLADFGGLVRERASQAWGWLTSTWNAVAPQVLPALGDFIAQVGAHLSPLATTVRDRANEARGWLQAHWNEIAPQVVPALGDFLDTIGPKLGDLVTTVQSRANEARGWLRDHWNEIAPVVTNDLHALTTQVGAALGGLRDLIVERTSGIRDWWDAHWGSFSAAISAVWTAITSVVGDKLAHLGDLFSGFGAALRVVQSYLQPVGDTLRAQVAPILQTLSQTLHENLLPAWDSLQRAFSSVLPLLQTLGQLIATQFTQAWNAALPVLKVIGVILGVTLLTVIGLFIGALIGIITALGQVIQGAIKFGGGLIQAIAGAVSLVIQFIGDSFAVLKDLFTGNWSAIGRDTQKLLDDLAHNTLQVLGGLWTAVQGLFQATVGALLGLISGFVSGVIGFFTHLWEQLVGHSIIPDLILGIVTWFLSLPERVFAGLATFVAGTLSHFRDLLTGAQLVWAALEAFLGATWERIVSTTEARVLGVKTWLFDRWHDVQTDVLTAFHAIEQSIADTWGRILSTVQTKVGDLKSALLSPFEQARDAIGGVLHSFADTMRTELNHGIGAFRDLLGGVASVVNGIASKLGAGSPIDVSKIPINDIPAFAGGAQNFRGGVALVGEEGPELAYLPPGTSVLPNVPTMQLLHEGLGFLKGVPGFAGGVGDFLGDVGGDIGGAVHTASSAAGRVKDAAQRAVGKAISDALGSVEHMFDKGAEWVVNTALGALHLDHALQQNAPGLLATLGGGALSTLKSDLLTFTRGLMDGMNSGAGGSVTYDGTGGGFANAANFSEFQGYFGDCGETAELLALHVLKGARLTAEGLNAIVRRDQAMGWAGANGVISIGDIQQDLARFEGVHSEYQPGVAWRGVADAYAGKKPVIFLYSNAGGGLPGDERGVQWHFNTLLGTLGDGRYLFGDGDNATAASGKLNIYSAANITSAQPYAEAVVGLANGGILTEPVVGLGLHSGARYLMGEAGAEAVVPLTGGRGKVAGVGTGGDLHIHQLTVNVTADEADGPPQAAGAAFGRSFAQAFAQARAQRGW